MWLLLLAVVAAEARQFEVPAYVCASLAEEPNLAFETELEDVTVSKGSEATLKCSVYGAPQAAIKWFHRGRRVEAFSTAGLELALPNRLLGNGLVESYLRIPCVDTKTVGDYVCVASSPCGQAITSEATIRMEKGAKGNPVQLMCRAGGFPKPSIKWYRITEDEQLEDVSKEHYMPLSNGDLLVIGDDANVVSESFRCVAVNPHGKAEADSTVIFMDE